MQIFDTVPHWILWLALTGGLAIITGIGMFIYLHFFAKPEIEERVSTVMKAISLVYTERSRQITDEDFDYIHDDCYKNDELAIAASYYLSVPRQPFNVATGVDAPFRWPLPADRWKPGGGREKQLVKAAALVIAELERQFRKHDNIHTELGKYKGFTKRG